MFFCWLKKKHFWRWGKKKGWFFFNLLHLESKNRRRNVLPTFFYPTKRPRTLGSAGQPWWRWRRSSRFPACSFCEASPWCWEKACESSSTHSSSSRAATRHVESRCSRTPSSPLVYLLQGVPTEGRPVLEDVVERVQSAQLSPLLLVVNRRGRSGRSRGRKWGRGGWEIPLLNVPVIPVPPLCPRPLSSSSSSFLLVDFPRHAAQLLQAASPFLPPLTGWVRSTSHSCTSSSSSSTPTPTTSGRYISGTATVTMATPSPSRKRAARPMWGNELLLPPPNSRKSSVWNISLILQIKADCSLKLKTQELLPEDLQLLPSSDRWASSADVWIQIST